VRARWLRSEQALGPAGMWSTLATWPRSLGWRVSGPVPLSLVPRETRGVGGGRPGTSLGRGAGTGRSIPELRAGNRRGWLDPTRVVSARDAAGSSSFRPGSRPLSRTEDRSLDPPLRASPVSAGCRCGTTEPPPAVMPRVSVPFDETAVAGRGTGSSSAAHARGGQWREVGPGLIRPGYAGTAQAVRLISLERNETHRLRERATPSGQRG
jgi:hypothetical protein